MIAEKIMKYLFIFVLTSIGIGLAANAAISIKESYKYNPEIETVSDIISELSDGTDDHLILNINDISELEFKENDVIVKIGKESDILIKDISNVNSIKNRYSKSIKNEERLKTRNFLIAEVSFSILMIFIIHILVFKIYNDHL